jgi:peptidoglycan/LPS O-acetylase OafA/YrhL
MCSGMSDRQLSGRVASLDGLRGLAASLVILTHALLAGIAYRTIAPRAFVTWGGSDAVAVFFVLSGFVLVLPVIDGPMRLRSYYPARALRLYLPVWAAIAFAAALHMGTDWRHIDGASWWLNNHGEHLEVQEAARDATLFKTGGWAYVQSLWSLRWEVIFSVLLPLYVLVGRATRRLPIVMGVIMLALIGLDKSEYLRYPPIFFLGTLLAFQVPRARAMWASLSDTGRAAVVVATAVLCTADAWAPAGSNNGGIGAMLSALGAIGILALAVVSGAFDRFLTRPRVHWLGTRSFSLYLVQEAVIVSVAFLLGGRPNTILYLALAIPATLVVAEVFFRVVERPSHILSRKARRLFAPRLIAPPDVASSLDGA